MQTSQKMKKHFLLARVKEIKTSNKLKELQKAQGLTETQALKNVIDQELKKGPNNSNFSSFVDDINSGDRFKRHIGIIGVRKLLCQEQNPPIQRTIDAGLVPKFLEFAQFMHEPHLALEAIWNLTNIASGSTEQTKFIIEKGAIICLVNNLKHPNLKIAEQAIWALGNIAGDSPDLRDAVLKWGAIYPLIKCFLRTNKIQIKKHGAWMLSNLCRGRPPPSIAYVEPALEPLCEILKQSHDNETIIETAWALASLLDHESLIDRFLATRANDALVSHLNNSQIAVLTPCLRAIGEIASGTDKQTQVLISHPGLIPRLMVLITNPRMTVRREVCWILSNIAAGSGGQFIRVLENNLYFEQILTVAQTDAIEVRREALWVFGNAVNSSALEGFDVETQIKIITCFVDSLDIQDAKGLSVCIEGIKCMLSQENKNFNQEGGKRIVFDFLQEAEIKQKIMNFQQHLDVSKNVQKIIQLLDS